jgi:hypothetical protein
MASITQKAPSAGSRTIATLLLVALVAALFVLAPPTPGEAADAGTQLLATSGQSDGRTRTITYPVTVPEAGLMTVGVTWPTTADVNLRVRTAAGTTIARSATPVKPEQLSVEVAAGNYLVDVEVGRVVTGFSVTARLFAGNERTYLGAVSRQKARTVDHPLTLAGPGRVTAVLDWATGANLNLTVLSPTGSTLASARTTSRPEQLTFDAQTAGTYRLRVEAASGDAAYSLATTFVPTVAPPPSTPPTLTTPTAQSHLEGDAVSLQVQASDTDTGDTLTYGATGLPPGLSIAASTGLIGGTIADGAANASPYTVDVSVTDGRSTPVTAQFTWTVGRAPVAGPKIDLKVLLLTQSGSEPTTEAWRSVLSSHGVPFDEHDVDEPISADALASPDHARYQGIVVATSAVWEGLDSGSRAVVEDFQRTFGIRKLTSYIWPNATYGLGGTPYGGLDIPEASLTSAGAAAFPYLRGPVPIESWAWGYQGAVPLDPATFTTWVRAADGSSLVGVFQQADGREELVSTVDMNPHTINGRLLLPGMLEWLTRGVHAGHWRSYLALHVDDVLLADDRWNTVTNQTDEDGPNPIRMSASDVTRAVNWSQSKGVVLDSVFNGLGATDYGSNDQLTSALLAAKGDFRWINHTYTHLNLDTVDQATIEYEIQTNIDWANANGIPIDPTELVTGEHSGLGLLTGLSNPAMPQALETTGIRWIAGDNSRNPQQTAIGPALTVPRHPTNLYYNVGTFAEQLDEYNWVYLRPPEGQCVDTSINTCLDAPATWSQYVNAEATIMFSHVTGNDPKPHYLHQSNLAEQGTMYPIVDEVLARHDRLYRTPLEQPTLKGAGELLRDRAAWATAISNGEATLTLQGGVVEVTTSRPLQVPLTGTTVGTAYAGNRSGWTLVDGTASFATLQAPGYGPIVSTVTSSTAAPVPNAPDPVESTEPLGLAPAPAIEEPSPLP